MKEEGGGAGGCRWSEVEEAGIRREHAEEER